MITTEELDALDALLREWDLSSASLADAQARLADEGSGVASKHVRLSQDVSRAERAVDAAGIAIADGIIPNIPRLLSAARQAETLRAKLAETEQARHEARYYANEVAAERDNLQSRLNQAEHAAKMLTAKLIESETWRTEMRQEMDAVKGRLREVTAQRDAAVKELRWHERDGNVRPHCSCCGGESLCDGCEDGCALSAAQEEVKP